LEFSKISQAAQEEVKYAAEGGRLRNIR